MSSFGVFFRSCTKRKCDNLFILYFSQYIFLSKKSVKCLFKNSIKSQNIHKKIFLLLTFSQRFGSLRLFLCVCEFINAKIKKGKCSSESKKAKIFIQLFLFCYFWDDFWVLRRKKHSFAQNSKENGFTFFSHLSNISLFKFHGHFFGNNKSVKWTIRSPRNWECWCWGWHPSGWESSQDSLSWQAQSFLMESQTQETFWMFLEELFKFPLVLFRFLQPHFQFPRIQLLPQIWETKILINPFWGFKHHNQWLLHLKQSQKKFMCSQTIN